MRGRDARRLALVVVLACPLGACRDRESAMPERQTTTGMQPRMHPTAVEGCLRAGVANNTFVLTASRAEGAGDAGTYELTGPESLNMRAHLGQQVQVEGTVRAAEEVASTSGTARRSAPGVPETPVVETLTKVEVRRLAVSAIRPLRKPCAE
jgi:hypothetical protein